MAFERTFKIQTKTVGITATLVSVKFDQNKGEESKYLFTSNAVSLWDCFKFTKIGLFFFFVGLSFEFTAS
jgi:hypothetical protein